MIYNIKSVAFAIPNPNHIPFNPSPTPQSNVKTIINGIPIKWYKNLNLLSNKKQKLILLLFEIY